MKIQILFEFIKLVYKLVKYISLHTCSPKHVRGRPKSVVNRQAIDVGTIFSENLVDACCGLFFGIFHLMYILVCLLFRRGIALHYIHYPLK